MPPKFRYTKEEIIKAALEITQSDGWEAVSARTVGAKLGASSKIIFGSFRGMEELRAKVIEAAYEYFEEFTEQELKSGKYPPYKASGMAYIRFAEKESRLFKLLYMRDRTSEDTLTDAVWDKAVNGIMQALGLDREAAELFHFEMWTCVHGMATMLATGYLMPSEELISNVLSNTYSGISERIKRGE